MVGVIFMSFLFVCLGSIGGGGSIRGCVSETVD